MRLRIVGSARLRIALGLAFAATAVGLAIDMSGAAPRLAGDDKAPFPPPALTDTLPGGGLMCIGTVLPDGAARLVMTIGTAPHPRVLPRIAVTFTTPSGGTLARGLLRAGAAPGEEVSIQLGYPHGPSAYGTLCLRAGGRPADLLVFGGESFPGASSLTTIDGAVEAGRPTILFYRPGRETWWSLLGALDLRFGLGKSPIFGDWTLPVLALAALALWFAVTRLLLRELR